MLVVEDGTAPAGAESYCSVAYANTHFAALETEAWALGDTLAKESALRRGTRFIDTKYRAKFPGVRTYGRDQSLAWPRINATDADGLIIGYGEIPHELKDACAEAALRELVYPGALMPDFVAAESMKSVSFGSVTIQYDDPGGEDVFRLIDQILTPVITAASQLYTALAVRG